MLVSVIMPVYNKEEFIGAAIESILNQTYRDFELLVADDNSTDNSVEVIKHYMKKDKRIKLYCLNKNHGVGYATNFLVNKSNGEFIARMDADDISVSTRIEKQLKCIKDKDYDVVGCKFDVFSENELPDGIIRYRDYSNSIIDDEKIVEHFTIMPTILQGTMMYKKEVLEMLPLNINYKTAEDYEQLGRFIKSNKKIGKLNEILFKYRHVHNSLSNDRWKEGVVNGFKIKLDFISNYFNIDFNESTGIYIWGTKDFAKLLSKKLKELRYNVKGYIDFNSDLWNLIIDEEKIYSPEDLIAKRKKNDVILTMWNIDREEIIKFLNSKELVLNRDYFVLS